MEPNLKNISLAFRCKENYDAMNDCNNGKHCNKCNHTVVDFTNSSQKEYDDYINENKDKDICGKFSLSQMSKTYLKSQMASVLLTVTALNLMNREYSFVKSTTTPTLIGLIVSQVGKPILPKKLVTEHSYFKANDIGASTKEDVLKNSIIKFLEIETIFKIQPKNKLVRFELFFNSKGKVIRFKSLKGSSDLLKIIRKKLMHKRFVEAIGIISLEMNVRLSR